MKNLNFLSLLVIGLLMLGCTPTEDAASNLGEPMDLRASFMSDQDGVQLADEDSKSQFVYRFNYNGRLLTLVDEVYEGSSEWGANFEATGGAEITTSTWLPTEIEYKGRAVSEEQMGDLMVYRYSDLAEDHCSLEYALVPMGDELLRLQMRACEGDDVELGRAAMEDLLDDLFLEVL
jgi:hypothetical protein